MKVTAPPAAGVRHHWADLPDSVRSAALAGYFLAHSLMPDPPGLPTVRAFQGAQAAAALEWLRGRLGRRTR
ncbi:hypothetical protein ACIA8E_20775 [Streptomyces sp. NPDC051664]|uniref:hypothetical protein n=1 Tax=Streptomyces sp. NPDC051664 TaxID=3365668 RepID=UPI0037A2A45A